MKRYWFVVKDDVVITDGYLPIIFDTEKAAEEKARSLAETLPGQRFSVFVVVSSFCVSAMVEERAK